MSENSSKPRRLWGNVKVELDLSNVTKEDLKNSTVVDTLKCAKKIDLASWKSEINKLDIGNLETAPVDLSKLSDVIKNEVVKMSVYEELVKKVNAIQATYTNNLVKKAETQKLLKLKRKYLIMIIIISMLLLKNLID